MKLTNWKIIFLVCLSIVPQFMEATTTKEVFAKYPNKYFVETGSCMGEGIQMAIDAGFKKIYSIELNEAYYKNCCLRFTFYPFVKLYLGDSSKDLPLILKEIDAPATFWLDGHYSGSDTAKGQTNTPLIRELEHIANHPIKTHTILIDDIRQLGTEALDYITYDQLVQMLLAINPNYQFSFEEGYIANDILVAKIP